MSEAIRLDRVSFTYSDGRVALSDVSFGVVAGERVALLGPNGAGKSTLLLQLNGILRGAGAIAVDGLALADDTLMEIRRRVGVVFQDPNDQLFCPTVGDDVAFGPMQFGFTKDRVEAIVQEALGAVGMAQAIGRPAHHLSVGERRRVTIACVLACDPTILALDEPAAMLDPRRRRWLIDFLKGCRQTVLLATHDLDFARATCGRAIVMEAGRVIADGPVEGILADRTLLERIF